MNSKAAIHLVITLAGIAFLMPFIGLAPLFDWDEINFAESAREMLVTGNLGQVTIGFEPFWEKPPLFIWMQALCMQIFGVNEFAARLPNVIAGVVSFNLLYHFGRTIRNHFTGIFWVVAYAGSLAPALYYRSGIIDPVFNLFIFLSIWHLFRAESARSEAANPRINMVLAGLFAGLAVLTKGPVSLLLIGMVWFVRLIYNPKHAWSGWFNSLLALLSCVVVTALWVIPELVANGTWFFKEFIYYQMELFKGQMDTHEQPWFYHALVLLFLCFPSSIFALPHLFRNREFAGDERMWSAYMRIFFWVVLLVFSIVSTKIIHYSSLCWLPLGWFAGNTLYKSYTSRQRIVTWLVIPYAVVLLVLSAALILVPLVFGNAELKGWVMSNVPNKLFGNILAYDTAWTGWECIPGVLFLLLGLYWLFQFRSLPAHWPFVLVAALGICFSTTIIPKTSQSLQGNFVKELKAFEGKDVYVEAWGFKTYAVYFYAKTKPEMFEGAWLKTLNDFKQFQNPRAQARLIWLMDRKVDKPVFIFTKSDYTVDWFFNDKFKLLKTIGGHQLWTRKDINKPDIRY